MRNKQQVKVAIYAAIVVVLVAGAYLLMRPPAPKPIPEPSPPAPAPIQPAPKAPKPEPIPGVPILDVGKYKTEPVITVWRADRGYIESMPLEKYIEGVIAQEMEPDWPMEALAAQAIAARTTTIGAIEAGTIRKLRNADVSTSKDELQAYAPEKVNDRIRQAVKRTRGEVLLYAGGLVVSLYSSHNGHITASKEESFPKEIPHPTPYFRAVKDEFPEYAPQQIQSWTVKIPGYAVAAAVGYNGNPADIRILERGPSGRILFIGAGNKKVYGSEFRRAVGYDILKSTLVDEMTYDGRNFIFKGRGWGNGIGMSQWGAYGYAMQGWKAEDIVRFYFVGAEVQKLWE